MDSLLNQYQTVAAKAPLTTHKALKWIKLTRSLTQTWRTLFPPKQPVKQIILNQPPATVGQIPTLYLHGFRGGDHTTNKLVLSAQKALRVDRFLKVFVDWQGRLTYEGSWPPDRFPLLQIIFKDKWIATDQISAWLGQILPKLQRTFGFSRYNAVGHSIAATAIVQNAMIHSADHQFPKLNKLVMIAGPFNGVVALGDLPHTNPLDKNGRPRWLHPHYCALLKRKEQFPPGVSVLNVYGNTGDGRDTDHYITNNSSRSIGYILAPKVQHYQELKVTGKAAEHSQLHDDDHVLARINHFLFNQGPN